MSQFEGLARHRRDKTRHGAGSHYLCEKRAAAENENQLAGLSQLVVSRDLVFGWAERVRACHFGQRNKESHY